MVKQFEAEEHYATICDWYRARKQNPIPIDMLPTFGLIVPKIAAGFLIVTDSNLAFLEFYISNPTSKKEHRDLALDQITKGLLNYGQSIGITNFKADTDIAAIAYRAERFGFKNIGKFSNYFLKMRE